MTWFTQLALLSLLMLFTQNIFAQSQASTISKADEEALIRSNLSTAAQSGKLTSDQLDTLTEIGDSIIAQAGTEKTNQSQLQSLNAAFGSSIEDIVNEDGGGSSSPDDIIDSLQSEVRSMRQ